MTLPGTTLGSVHYFSPEQARGETTTEASDIYSLGIVLYEMLTGVRPWTGDSAASVALARLTGPVPDPMVVRPTLPPGSRGDHPQGAGAGTGRPVLVGGGHGRCPRGHAGDAGPGWSGRPPLAGRRGRGARRCRRAVRSRRRCPASPPRAARRERLPRAAGSVISGTGTARTRSAGAVSARGLRRRRRRDAYSATRHGGALRRAHRPGAAAARDEDADDEGGTSPLVWLTGIIAIALLAGVAYLVFQFASGANPGPSASPEIVTVPNFVDRQLGRRRPGGRGARDRARADHGGERSPPPGRS